MCGRFTLRAPASLIAEQFSLLELEPFAPRFNIAPGQLVAVVRPGPIDAGAVNDRLAPRIPAETAGIRGSHGRSTILNRGIEGGPALTWLRWGLIPFWAKTPAIGNRLINARSETVLEKAAFREAFRQRRCLIVGDGFYEWQGGAGRKNKQAYFFHFRDNCPFAFGGLWDSWEGGEGRVIESCTVLTTEANEIVRPIHDRMPVILPSEAYRRWLTPESGPLEDLLGLLRPFPSDAMVAMAVGPWVNRPTNDDPRCLEPEASGQQKTWF